MVMRYNVVDHIVYYIISAMTIVATFNIFFILYAYIVCSVFCKTVTFTINYPILG